jgi:hypothetical protein
MSGENGGKARGTIIKVPDASPGLLFVNGEQKSFTLAGVWKSPVAPAPNMIVDVELDSSNSVVSITQVDLHQARKEQMSHASAVAQEQGKHAAELAKKGFGELVARMGIIALSATVLHTPIGTFWESTSATCCRISAVLPMDFLRSSD